LEWTERHGIYLCREIIVVDPFQFKKGTVDRGKLWTKIAESLNSCKEIKFKVGMRSVRERFTAANYRNLFLPPYLEIKAGKRCFSCKK